MDTSQLVPSDATALEPGRAADYPPSMSLGEAFALIILLPEASRNRFVQRRYSAPIANNTSVSIAQKLTTIA
jgi:hypothetical protein